MDATAARTFVSLHVRLQRLGVQLVITHLPDEVPALRKLLASQGLILRTPSGQEEGHVAGSEIEAAGEECGWRAAAGPGWVEKRGANPDRAKGCLKFGFQA